MLGVYILIFGYLALFLGIAGYAVYTKPKIRRDTPLKWGEILTDDFEELFGIQ